MQAPLEQHPFGQVVALQTHAPPSHAVPLGQVMPEGPQLQPPFTHWSPPAR
jgi:hypothetical protein